MSTKSGEDHGVVICVFSAEAAPFDKLAKSGYYLDIVRIMHSLCVIYTFEEELANVTEILAKTDQ